MWRTHFFVCHRGNSFCIQYIFKDILWGLLSKRTLRAVLLFCCSDNHSISNDLYWPTIRNNFLLKIKSKPSVKVFIDIACNFKYLLYANLIPIHRQKMRKNSTRKLFVLTYQNENISFCFLLMLKARSQFSPQAGTHEHEEAKSFSIPLWYESLWAIFIQN